MKHEILYCDAGTSNNGQFGRQSTIIVVADLKGKILAEKFVGDKTNNEGEMLGIIEALKFRPKVVFSDSQLAVDWALSVKFTGIARLQPQVWQLRYAVYMSDSEIRWIPREYNLAGQYIEDKHKL